MIARNRVRNPALAQRFADLLVALSMFGLRGWATAINGAITTLLAIGAVADLYENPIFERQLAARPQDYVIWVVSGVLGGLILGTFAVTRDTSNQSQATYGGVLSVIAVGCPICNKVAVMLLGTSGALNLFGPTQILLGVGSILLLAWTLLLRAQAVAGSCPIDRKPTAGPAILPSSSI